MNDAGMWDKENYVHMNDKPIFLNDDEWLE